VIWIASLLAFAVCLLLSAVFSGAETGFYCVSPLRVDAEAESGRRSARLARGLMRDDTGLLITILIGNNLMIELLTHLAEERLSATGWVPEHLLELVLALVLTPLVFFAAELLPKDLFRRRPHLLVGYVAPLIALARLVFMPLVVPLRALSAALIRSSGLDRAALASVLGHEAVLELLEAGRRAGALGPHAERLARNVLDLRGKSAASEMVPWSEVETVDLATAPEEQFERASRSKYTRLPVVDPEGVVVGYVHQLDVLRAGPGQPLAELVRPLPTIPPDVAVYRALSRMRTTGQRAALVGSPDGPSGLVTLKDLVETISGELAHW